MPAPLVIESIVADLEETLNGVKLEAGFCIDLRAQRARKRNDVDDGVCIISVGRKVPDELTTGAPEGVVFWRQRILLQIYVFNSDRAEESADVRWLAVAADVERRLMEDPQRGGNAHDTVFDEIAPFEEVPTGHPGVIVALDVQYGHYTQDPTQHV